jgi:hypothetical protein
VIPQAIIAPLLGEPGNAGEKTGGDVRLYRAERPRMDEILDRAWLAPSRYCLVNADKTLSVNKSFEVFKALREYFKEKYKLY